MLNSVFMLVSILLQHAGNAYNQGQCSKYKCSGPKFTKSNCCTNHLCVQSGSSDMLICKQTQEDLKIRTVDGIFGISSSKENRSGNSSSHSTPTFKRDIENSQSRKKVKLNNEKILSSYKNDKETCCKCCLRGNTTHIARPDFEIGVRTLNNYPLENSNFLNQQLKKKTKTRKTVNKSATTQIYPLLTNQAKIWFTLSGSDDISNITFNENKSMKHHFSLWNHIEIKANPGIKPGSKDIDITLDTNK